MRAGLLRHRVTIQVATEVNTTGSVSRTWADLTTVSASVEPLTGREFMEAQQLGGQVSHRVTMRYYSALTVRHRITHDGRTLNIVAVLNPDERNIETVAMCKEAV